MAAAAPEDLPARNGRTLGLLAASLGRRTESSFVRALAGLALRPQEFAVLSFVHQQAGCSQQDVATSLRLDSGNLVSVIARLEERGALRRERDLADRRRYILALTAKGRRLHASAQDSIITVEAELFSRVPVREREELRALLLRVRQHLS